MTTQLVRRTVAATLTKLAGRRYRFRASTGRVDHMRDTIDPSAWELAGPVKVLWNHDASTPALGIATPMLVPGALDCVVEFLPPGLSALADDIVARIEAGYPPDCSVGMIPTVQPERNEAGGFSFRGQRLLELSMVNLPANADARLLRAVDRARIERWVLERAVPTPDRRLADPRIPLKGEVLIPTVGPGGPTSVVPQWDRVRRQLRPDLRRPAPAAAADDRREWGDDDPDAVIEFDGLGTLTVAEFRTVVREAVGAAFADLRTYLHRRA